MAIPSCSHLQLPTAYGVRDGRSNLLAFTRHPFKDIMESRLRTYCALSQCTQQELFSFYWNRTREVLKAVPRLAKVVLQPLTSRLCLVTGYHQLVVGPTHTRGGTRCS